MKLRGLSSSILFVAFALALMASNLGAADTPDDNFPPDQLLHSTHFTLRHQTKFAPAGILNTLEGLHAKLLLDLGPFCGWAFREKIPVFLYDSPESYTNHTGMPEWSGAYVNIQTRTVYAYDGNGFQRVMAHELAHLFFTQFFIEKSTQPPVWLNEGVATLMEWDHGLGNEPGSPDRRLERNGLAPLSDLFANAYQRQGDQSPASVTLWYNQCESVTRFLMRRFSSAQFVRFCDVLRQGKSMDDALKAGYGLMIPDVAALEKLWLDSLGR